MRLVLCVVPFMLAQAAAAAPEWSYQFGLGVSDGQLDAAGAGADPSVDTGWSYGFTIDRIGERFGFGFETSDAFNDVGPNDRSLELDHYLFNGIAVLPIGARSRLVGALGVGAFRSQFRGSDDWSPGGQVKLGVETRWKDRNWIGVTGKLRRATDVDLGPNGEVELTGTDLQLTFRRKF